MIAQETAHVTEEAGLPLPTADMDGEQLVAGHDVLSGPGRLPDDRVAARPI